MLRVDRYLKLSARLSKTSEEILEECKEFMVFNFGERVLDVGCGPGDFTCGGLASILHKNTEIVGIDMSPEMISYAKKNYEGDNKSFKVIDIRKPIGSALDKGSFNKVFSFFCLHFVHDLRSALSNIHQLLKVAGITLVSFLSYHPVFIAYKIMSHEPEWHPYMKDYKACCANYLGVEEPEKLFGPLLKESGFNVMKCYNRECVDKFETLDTYLDLLKGFVLFTNRMPLQLHAKYHETLKKTLIDNKLVEIAEDGELTLRFKTLVAVAEKEHDFIWM